MADLMDFFYSDLKPRIESDPIDDLRRVDLAASLQGGITATTGKQGRFVFCVFAGGASKELMGGNDDIWTWEIYNLVTAVWKKGGPLSEYSPVLLKDMQHIRDLVHKYNFPSKCYALSQRIFRTNDYTVQSTNGLSYGAYAGFELNVSVLEI
jgi:hypothetical protein